MQVEFKEHEFETHWEASERDLWKSLSPFLKFFECNEKKLSESHGDRLCHCFL